VVVQKRASSAASRGGGRVVYANGGFFVGGEREFMIPRHVDSSGSIRETDLERRK
jgi:hypothetical protein